MPTDDTTWVFAYGSLLWKPDFDFRRSVPAVLNGWTRRFWQGSPDHRGTKAKPGRVVTLVRQPNASCAGIAYQLCGQNVAEIMRLLDVREQGGYVRESLQVSLQNTHKISATTWIAHPQNNNFLGPASSNRIAGQIASAAGPSGSNLEYFLRLACALEALHVREAQVLRIKRWLHGKRHSL